MCALRYLNVLLCTEERPVWIRALIDPLTGAARIYTSSMSHPFLTFALAFAMMTAFWPLSRKLRDVSIVDILWAPAFAAVAFLCVFLGPTREPRGWIVLGLVSVWAVRLGSHVYRRWRRLGHEDYRYAEIRRSSGPSFPLTSLFWIFWLQALLLWIISWPLQVAFSMGGSLNWIDGLGVVMAVAGIVIEAVADAQLTRFRADPANQSAVLRRRPVVLLPGTPTIWAIF